MNLQEKITEIVVDLVTLSIKANNVVTQGQFPGEISDEVNSLLKMCKEIHNEYVVERAPSDGSSDDRGASDGMPD